MRIPFPAKVVLLEVAKCTENASDRHQNLLRVNANTEHYRVFTENPKREANLLLLHVVQAR